jgi:hypothetical protein
VVWLITATLGDVPTAILAGAGLLLGVWIMARGTRGGVREAPVAVAAAPPAPPAPAAPPVPDDDPPAPTTFRHGTIRMGSSDDGAPAASPAPEPEPEPELEPEPAAPPPPPLPQVPPTEFRQGRIRVGGIERGRRRDP